MGISQSTLLKVRSYEDIVGVIGQYVQLKRRGRNYIGLCPFHSEKSPSFTVSPEKHIFHCFGCHETGDLIGFIQKIENATFPEAIEIIADLAGIDMEYDGGSFELSKQDGDRQKIYDCLVLMRDYFRSELSRSSVACTYLDNRGIWPETIAKFHLGFGGKSADLVAHLRSKGYEPELLLKTGCFYGSRGEGVYCRFQDRLVFPIFDFKGKTVGFGGRILNSGSESKSDQAKYVNSEETPFFNKRKLLYGFDHAKSAIKQEKTAILMEGYMDVITAHQHGFTQAVGSMGTALTDEHAQRLKNVAQTVVLAFDSDDAGQQAAYRSVDILQKYEITTKIMDFSQKDPADVLSMPGGVDYFQDQLDHAIPCVDYYMDLYTRSVELDSIESVTESLAKIMPILRSQKDPVVLNHYVNRVALKLGIESQLVLEKLKGKAYNLAHRPIYSYKNKKNKLEKAEDYLIYFAAMDRAIRDKILGETHLDQLLTPVRYQLVSEMAGLNVTGRELLSEIQPENLRNELGRILLEVTQLQVDNAPSQIQTTTWNDCLDTLRIHNTAKRIQDLKDEIRALEKAGDDDAAVALLQTLQDLMNQ